MRPANGGRAGRRTFDRQVDAIAQLRHDLLDGLSPQRPGLFLEQFAVAVQSPEKVEQLGIPQQLTQPPATSDQRKDAIARRARPQCDSLQATSRRQPTASNRPQYLPLVGFLKRISKCIRLHLAIEFSQQPVFPV
ncbi:MAG: hypothetical protein JNL89_08720 [Rhodanobacteraceae bacterium]|nr:hypothetical protein [Rhodanobacteraceae bacterium]